MYQFKKNSILMELSGPVAIISINREDRRNALNPDVLEGILEAVSQITNEKDIRVLVLTGKGSKAFCAGADLKDSNDVFSTERDDTTTDFGRLARVFKSLGIPSIARVNGDCVAGGMALMSLCDLAIATEKARFGLPEAKVGVFPMQVLVYLRNHIYPRHINELILTGELIDSHKAQAIGLLNKVVKDEDLDHAINSMINKILGLSPVAIKKGKAAMITMESMGFAEALSYAESQIALISKSIDAREGISAFNEKRSPKWVNRIAE